MLACVLLPASAGQAATINVTTELDEPVGSGLCSLRSALAASWIDVPQGGCTAGSAGPDTVVLPAGLYSLSFELLVRGDVTIAGAGAGSTVVSQGGANRVMTLDMFLATDVDVTLDGLTLTGGHAPDGGNGDNKIQPAAPIGVAGQSATGGNGGFGAPGGAVYNPGVGTLTLQNARITGNSAGSGGFGGFANGGDGGPADGETLGGTGGNATGGTGGGGGDGGAIYSLGPVIVRDSVISGNSAGTGRAGGGATAGNGGGGGSSNQQGRAAGDAVGGSGGRGGDGGAIYASADVTVERSVISGNRAGGGGEGSGGTGQVGGVGAASAGTGGEGGQGTGGAGGRGGAGGAIRTTGAATVTIVSSQISGNSSGAGARGGAGTGGRGGIGGFPNGNGWFGGDGIGGDGGAGGDGAGVSVAGSLSATGSVFFDNHAGDGALGGSGSGGQGGAGNSSAGNGNTGGHGIGGAGGAGGTGAASVAGASRVIDTTVTQNLGSTGAKGGDGTGGRGGNAPAGFVGFGGQATAGNGGAAGAGGVALVAGELDVTHATLSSNTAGSPGAAGSATAGQPGTGGSAGGPGQAHPGTGGAPAGGGLHRAAGSVSLANSIVASNTPANCAGAIANGGNNIRFGDASCPGSTLDPKLAPLADNGGPTRTLALGAGSAALDAVPASGAGCTGADQRGVSRPRGAGCDAGAFERAAPGVTTGAASAISRTSATVAGSVTPNAGSATYRLQYGTTTAYGSSTAPQALGGGVSAKGVSTSLDRLASNTTYHYRLVATTSDGSAVGADRTFTTGAVTSGTDGTDGTPPRFLSASMRPRTFAVNRRGARERPVAGVARGTTFRFALSEDARVVFTIHRVVPGRRVGRRCVKPTPRNRSKRSCKRYVKPRRFAMNAKAGANRKRFSGRIGRRSLAPGSYRATLVARDLAGNASAARRLRFRVVRPG